RDDSDARLVIDGLLLAERAKAVDAVIRPGPARPHAAERLRLLREMREAAIDGNAARDRVAQRALAAVPRVAEEVERQRTVAQVDVFDGVVELVVRNDRQQWTEDLLAHD